MTTNETNNPVNVCVGNNRKISQLHKSVHYFQRPALLARVLWICRTLSPCLTMSSLSDIVDSFETLTAVRLTPHFLALQNLIQRVEFYDTFIQQEILILNQLARSVFILLINSRLVSFARFCGVFMWRGKSRGKFCLWRRGRAVSVV